MEVKALKRIHKSLWFSLSKGDTFQSAAGGLAANPVEDRA
jgi:hypothetical protein